MTASERALDDLCVLGNALSEHRSAKNPWSHKERRAFQRLESVLENLDNWPVQTGLTLVDSDLWTEIVRYAREDADDLCLYALVTKALKAEADRLEEAKVA